MSRRGGHHHPAPCPPHAPRWASSWVFAVIHVGPLEGFKLMIVLIRFAFEKELPGAGLGSRGTGGSLGPPQTFSAPAPRWSWPPEQRGQWLDTEAAGCTLLLLTDPPLHSICSAEHQVCGRDNSIKSRRTKLILRAVRHGGLNSFPFKMSHMILAMWL